MTEVSRADRRWVLGFALFLILLTSLATVLAYAHQSQDWIFSGFLFGVEDGHTYIAKMLRGAQGEWLFRSPYSTMEQGGALIYSHYLLLGRLLGPGAGHATFVALFQLFRIVAIGLLCLATYDFAALFLQERRQRRLALVLATLGGGLGWLILAGGETPLDFYSPETFGFAAILLGLSHLVLGRALLLWALVRYLRGRGSGWGSALLGLALVLTHLPTAGIALAVISAHLAFGALLPGGRDADWLQRLRQGAWILLGMLPVFAFNGYQLLSDTYLQAWSAQNQILSPGPVQYVLAYGLPLAFSGWGLPRLWRTDRTRASLLAAWILILPVLVYAPVGLQRRLADGVWVALIVAALAAFEAGGLWPGWQALFLFTLASSGILLVGSLQVAGSPRQPAFLPAGQVAGFEALNGMAEFDQVVLAAYDSGNALPAWAPLRVVIGHGPETANLAELSQQVDMYFQDPQANGVLLTEQGVDYVFVGPDERGLAGGAFEPASDLELVYDQGGYQIYRVKSSPAD